MANIAALLKAQGNNVTGADVAEVFPTDIVLERNAIDWKPFEKVELAEDLDAIVYSAAHGGKEHKLVKEAQKRGLKMVHQAELLGELLKEYTISLAVAGCHGKTTTSSLLAYALLQLGKDPSYMVGTPGFNEFEGAHIGDIEYFVVEADEYAMNPPADKTPKFHHLKPTNAIITNIDFDHPDVFNDIEDTKNAFEVFMNAVSSTNDAESLILCADDENLMEVAKRVQGKSIATYGLHEEAEYRVKNVYFDKKETTFSLFFQDEHLGKFSIQLPGEKNVVNTAGVITLLIQLGFTPDEIKSAVAGFTGAKRRFEHIALINGVDVFDDYAHHPHELEAILQAARSRYPGRPVRLVFQPHTFSRTELLASEFSHVLTQADSAIILPVFASAREEQTKDSYTNTKLKEISSAKNLSAPQTSEEAVEMLKKTITGNDVILMAGAGDVYKLQPAVLSMLHNR